ncbi:MAG: hypothetical protein PHH61_05630 [Candidatus Nanoarchaeia archaeon]|nr:hypothetical protein [Candidatus Nanoarchaeia archaeon]
MKTIAGHAVRERGTGSSLVNVHPAKSADKVCIEVSAIILAFLFENAFPNVDK